MIHGRDRHAGAEFAIDRDVVAGGATDGIFAVGAVDFDAADAGGDGVAVDAQAGVGVPDDHAASVDAGVDGVVIDAQIVASFADRVDADVIGAGAAAAVGEDVAGDEPIGIHIGEPNAHRRRLHAVVLDVAAGLGGAAGLAGNLDAG